MSLYSRSHQFASGPGAFWPIGASHTIHGKTAVTFWSDDGLTYTLRITRPNGVSIDAIIPATPNHYVTFDLHPDEGFNIQASSVGGSLINVMVV